jgi:hypothetical protein
MVSEAITSPDIIEMMIEARVIRVGDELLCGGPWPGRPHPDTDSAYAGPDPACWGKVVEVDFNTPTDTQPYRVVFSEGVKIQKNPKWVHRKQIKGWRRNE